MRTIEDLIQNVEKYKTALLQKRFESKKNTVGYVVLNGQPRILKWYVPGLKQNMENEFTVLKKGSPTLPMPTPLEKDADNNVLVLSYIIGKNLCDLINDPAVPFEEKQHHLTQLADWLIAFHTYFKTNDSFLIRGDATIRNFILGRDCLWGVDFEESRPGKPIEDVAGICASILTTDPMFTEEKFHLCASFLESYRKAAKWSLENINSEIAYALLEKIQWRPQDEDLLRKYASKIRSKGLHAASRHNH